MSTDPTPGNDDGKTATPTDGAADPQLGDAGKRALQAERDARREAERKAREATERATELEAADLRRTVAADKGLTVAQAAFLTGADREEMEAKADELLEAFDAGEPQNPAPRTPREALKPGAVPSAERSDVGKVAESVMRRP